MRLANDRSRSGIENIDTQAECPHWKDGVDFTAGWGAGRLAFLGTGSAIPSKYRNVSATLLQAADSAAILLDAGEGTLGQIARMVGRYAVQQTIDQLECVYISHMHADHHLGLVRVLLARTDDTPDLWVVGPPTLRLWLAEYRYVCIPWADGSGTKRF